MTKRETKKDKSDWFDSHVIVMGPNADFEDKMREALKKKVCDGFEAVYENACDDADCVCRQHASWPDNIASGCAARAES